MKFKQIMLSSLISLILIIEVFNLFIIVNAEPTIRIEYLLSGPNAVEIYSVNWKAMTFTTVESFNITSIEVLIKRRSNPSTLHAKIRATVSNKPSGEDLCSGTKLAGEIGTSYTWHEISMGSGYVLEADTKYALILKDAGNSANNYLWKYKSPGTYPGGNFCLSFNSGSSWSQQTGTDLPFKIWGDDVAPEHEITNVNVTAWIPGGSGEPGTVINDFEWFTLCSEIQILSDTSGFIRTRFDIDSLSMNLSISYVNSTDVFLVVNDPNNRIALDISKSNKTNINSESFYIFIRIRLFKNVTRENSYNVSVFTESDLEGILEDTTNFINVFSLNIVIPSSPNELFGAGFNSSVPYVQLYWNYEYDSSNYWFDLFEIQNSTDDISYTYLGKNSTREYIDITVINGTKMYYRIRACRLTGVGWKNSSWIANTNYEEVNFITTGIKGEDGITTLIIVPLIVVGIIIGLIIGILLKN